MPNINHIYIFDGKKIKLIPITYSKTIARGVETFFFPINSRRGLKVFMNRNNTKNSFRRQSLASKYNLGPKVLSEKIFQIIFPMGFEKIFPNRNSALRSSLNSFFGDKIGWGYYTQIAKMIETTNDYTSAERESLQVSLLNLFPVLYKLVPLFLGLFGFLAHPTKPHFGQSNLP